jgi:gliding motility-associated lipoprotein GldD
MKLNITIKLILTFIAFAGITGCGEDDYSPKPRAYFRIDLPTKEYKQLKTDCPFSFDYPVYSEVRFDNRPTAEPCWMNVEFPSFNGTIHISYKNIKNNLEQYLEDARSLTYKHVSRATDIRESVIVNEEAKVYGIIYDVKGDAASHVQFYMTDSLEHFIRGSLYFNVPPNQDSIAPVLNFIRKDITRMIETFDWKYE